MPSTSDAIFFAFDLETTGLNPNFDEIVAVSAMLLDSHLNTISTYTQYVFPTNGCSPEAAAINGYTEEKWKERHAISQKDLLGQIRKFTTGTTRLYPVGHNVSFDISFLKALFQRYNDEKEFGNRFSYQYIDTLSTTLLLDITQTGSSQGSYKLTNLAERFGISLDKAHDAEADLRATVELLRMCMQHIRGSLPLPESTGKKRKGSFMVKVGEVWTIQYGKYRDKSLQHAAEMEITYLDWILNNVRDLDDEARQVVLSFKQ